jgi:squalene synthase HpnC
MRKAAELRSGKGHRDENFPVASRLIAARHRGIIRAFYEFVRTADDIADHSSLAPAEKLALLDRLEASLVGTSDADAEGVALRARLAERGLASRHAQDLLIAFRMDVTKLRYANWDELIHYCSYSAMPVGRFVLDVHGESRATWQASDALCAALQIINHLQDCVADYRNLDRVYIPLDALAAEGASVESLAAPAASPALRRCLVSLTQRTDGLLRHSNALPDLVKNRRLSLEISVIETLAQRLLQTLRARDPLSEDVHLGKAAFAGIGIVGVVHGLWRRLTRRRSVASPRHQDA